MGKYSIKDLERLSGIKAHTLRIWEQRYDIISPKRTPTNIRFYDDEDLRLLLNISYLNRNGYKISKIAGMGEGEISEKVRKIADSNLETSNQTNALVIAMVNLDQERFEKIISTNTLQFGFESTMVNIVYPFLEQIGILWQTGSINPAHEHFITNLIRQKLIVAIDGQINNFNPYSKKFILFLPEGELHEIGLLFANYVIKSRHNQVVYLGQSLPMKDLLVAGGVYKPDYVFSIFTSNPAGSEVKEYVEELVAHFPECRFLFTGYQAIKHRNSFPENVTVFDTMQEAISYIDEASPKPFAVRENGSNGSMN